MNNFNFTSNNPRPIQHQQPSQPQSIATLKHQAQKQIMMGNFSQQVRQPTQRPVADRSQEYCPTYKEPYVGYNEATKELVCNTSIYQKKLVGVKFIALISKELRKEFSRAFEEFQACQQNMDHTDPLLAKQRMGLKLSEFFNQLSQRIKHLEKDVMARIRVSDSLKQLEQILESSREFFQIDKSQPDNFEKEKKLFDEKIDKGRYSFLVKRQDFYRELIDSIDTSSDKMKKTIEQSNEQVAKVLSLKSNDQFINQQISAIVKECIQVDCKEVPVLQRSPIQHFKAVRNSPQQTQQVQQSQQSNISQSPVTVRTASEHQMSPAMKSAQFSPAEQKSPQCDEVQILTESTNLIREHQYRTTYKLKSMALLKLVPGRGWAKITDCQNLFLAKCVTTIDEVAFVIGGARDNKSQQTISTVKAFGTQDGRVKEFANKAPMICSRSSFGCTYNVHTNEIYVAGGYENGQLSRKCEKYDIAANKWTELPILTEEKCSASLCTLDGRYLYCVGGLAKNQSGAAYLLSSIEVLDLQAASPRWTMLTTKMPVSACDIGMLPISDSEILVFGGWNKMPLTQAFVFKVTNKSAMTHEIRLLQTCLEKADFFLMTGQALKQTEKNKVKICGHSSLFTFDTEINQFEGFTHM